MLIPLGSETDLQGYLKKPSSQFSIGPGLLVFSNEFNWHSGGTGVMALLLSSICGSGVATFSIFTFLSFISSCLRTQSMSVSR